VRRVVPGADFGVLFDVDGTLIDSGYLHAVCWWQALRKYGLDAPMATIHRAVGMGSDRLVPHVLGNEGTDQLAELSAAHDALFSVYWSSLRRLPGARELVRRCHDAGLVTVLASSANGTELGVLRTALDADEWLDHATSAADGDSSKPEPDLVEVALGKAGLQPDQAIFLGDAVWDVEAAGRAGVPCIGVECGGTSAAELRDAGAVQTYRDPADLLAGWAQSPLAGFG
jgi:HAD superfamily hydrolase (TIGR01509 family)